jgi:hypothetical protein
VPMGGHKSSRGMNDRPTIAIWHLCSSRTTAYAVDGDQGSNPIGPKASKMLERIFKPISLRALVSGVLRKTGREGVPAEALQCALAGREDDGKLESHCTR